MNNQSPLQGMALKGIRIITVEDLLALPWGSMQLADLGAEVIRAESHTRLRARAWGPWPDGKPNPNNWWNQGGNHGLFYRNKKSLTLDLTKPKAVQLFKELVKVSDIVTENSRPGVMERLGLEYATLKELKPDLIMLGSSGFGQTGEWRRYGAVARTIDAVCGMSHTTGYESGPPVRANPSYMDITSGWTIALALLLALHHRRKTGEGQYIDLSMYETGMSCIGQALLDEQVNHRETVRLGNKHPWMAPHGCYPCQGTDKWIVIAIKSDDEWKRLVRVMGKPSWANDEKFDTLEGRWEHSQELDEQISQWSKIREARELMNLLQAANVTSGTVYNSQDLLTDPHLINRKFFEPLTRPPEAAVGTKPYVSRPYKLSKTPARKASIASLGEHNSAILKDLLGLSDKEVDSIYQEGIIDWVPRGPDAVTPRAMPQEIQIGNGAIVDPHYKEVLRLHINEEIQEVNHV